MVTDEDWEVNKSLSSRSVIEAMNIPAVLERGFHLKPRECFPAAPSFLRGVGGVSSGSAFTPLWSLRFFASRVYGRRGPNGLHSASAPEKLRLKITVPAELLICFALGIAAEREANQQTRVLPEALSNLLLRCNPGDEIPTHRSPLGIRTIAERLMKAQTVDPKHHITERPLHVRSLLCYVTDSVLDADESPVLGAPPPVCESAIPRRSPFSDPCAPIRAMDVESESRAPAVPGRPQPALPLRSVAPPRSPSFTVPQPPVQPPAPVSVPPPTPVPGPAVPVVLCLINNTQALCSPTSSITNPARSGLRVRSASVPTIQCTIALGYTLKLTCKNFGF